MWGQALVDVVIFDLKSAVLVGYRVWPLCCETFGAELGVPRARGGAFCNCPN